MQHVNYQNTLYLVACRDTYRLAKAGELYHGTVYPEDLNVPCGKCVPCKQRRVQDWVFRMKQEDKVSSSSFFVTLTYSDEFLTYTSDKFPTLVQKDFQNFMKRLRKINIISYKEYNWLPRSKWRINCIDKLLRYYAVGEYGETYKRPHYHIILFNLLNEELIPKAWTHPRKNKLIGNIHIGQVTGASIAYTTKYIDKHRTVPLHNFDKRLPEFSNMSQGLGKNYHESHAIQQYHQADIERIYVTYPDGRKIALPRYYRNKLYNKSQQLQQNAYIVKKLEDDNIQEEYKFEKKYQKTDYNYTTYKATQVLGEYQRFYFQGKRTPNITDSLISTTRIPSTEIQKINKGKGKLQINDNHRRTRIDFTESDNSRPESDDCRNTTEAHQRATRHGI